eukprot:TRINITY_DN49044_c0_g1_i1.p1 TRINITY_DN49044_c0_g1~~TRINITY_DN49044_c0_g1_i1.p1  ORF type:complete len:159 (+),score=24.94 TRINITY_DN49044_c0_g1_i1:263-739(+)
MACVNCVDGSTPVGVEGGDSTSCKCDNAAQSWNADENTCDGTPSPVPTTPVPTTPVPTTPTPAHASVGSGGPTCAWWCVLLIAGGALAICGGGVAVLCVVRSRSSNKPARRGIDSAVEPEAELPNLVTILHRDADQGPEELAHSAEPEPSLLDSDDDL